MMLVMILVLVVVGQYNARTVPVRNGQCSIFYAGLITGADVMGVAVGADDATAISISYNIGPIVTIGLIIALID